MQRSLLLTGTVFNSTCFNCATTDKRIALRVMKKIKFSAKKTGRGKKRNFPFRTDGRVVNDCSKPALLNLLVLAYPQRE
jgi:hypothetical protein